MLFRSGIDCMGEPGAQRVDLRASINYMGEHGAHSVDTSAHIDSDGVARARTWDRPGFDDETVLSINKTIGEMGRRFPDRLIPFATVNPTREKACDMLKRCVEDYGCVGMKWHPDVAGFIPSDKKYYDFLQLMDDYEYRDPPKSRYVCTPGLLRAQFATEGPVPRHAPSTPHHTYLLNGLYSSPFSLTNASPKKVTAPSDSRASENVLVCEGKS